MTPSEKYQAVREAVIAAHSDLAYKHELGLADVLMAIRDIELETGGLEMDVGGQICIAEYGWDDRRNVVARCQWNLAESFDQQSQTVIDFLYDILCTPQSK